MNYNFVVFECLVSIGLGAFIWFYLFDRLRRDTFRSDIRRIRDGLFDFMWKNGYDFQTPAYQETRQLLNGITVIAKFLRPVSFLLMTAYCAANKSEGGTDGNRWVCSDPKLDAELKRVRDESVRVMLSFTFLSGWFSWFVWALLLSLGALHRAFQAKEWATRKGEQLSEWAYVMGKPHIPTTGVSSFAAKL